MTTQQTFTGPPIGPDGLIDIMAIARRATEEPAPQRAPLDLAALDAATPAAPVGPFVQMAAQPAPTPTPAPATIEPQSNDHQLLVNEVAATDSPTKPGLPEGAVEVDLLDATGETVVATFVVLGGDDWPSEINPWMRDPMKWHEWAMAVLANDDGKLLWQALRPTNRQTSRFITAYLVKTGALPAPKEQP